MDSLFYQYTIFKQVEQLNLEEYCFYALDNKDNLFFIHFDFNENYQKIEDIGFKLSQLKTLSQYSVSYIESKINSLKQIFDKIKIKDEQEILCNLSLDQIFVRNDQESSEIIIPKYILKQLKISKYRDLFIQNFFQSIKSHRVEPKDLYEENKKNINIMRKIKTQRLNLNDVVSEEIKLLFETLFQVSISQIQQISISTRDNLPKYKHELFNSYKRLKNFYQNNLINVKKLPAEDLKILGDFVQTKLFTVGNYISEKCVEIENYKQKQQQGLRLTATQVYEVCEQKQQQTYEISEYQQQAMEYGIKNEKKALDEYQFSHPDCRLAPTDVLYNISYPFLCGKPDALIYDLQDNLKGLIEVKSPYSKKDVDLKNDSNFQLDYIEMDINNEFKLKKTHKYYYQVQVYLLITELSWCQFIVSTDKGNREIKVMKDSEFIKSIINKTASYYLKTIFPQLNKLKKNNIEDDDLKEMKQKLIF